MLNRFFRIAVVAAISLMAFAPFAQSQWDVTDTSEDKGIKDMMKGKEGAMDFQASSTVEMQADQVQYAATDNVAQAKGNVVMTSGSLKMTADQVELDRARQTAAASGNVHVDSSQFQIDAESGDFSFTERTGAFNYANVWQTPFALNGRRLVKLDDTHMVMENGYLTTCDHDEPHFRLQMRRMDFFAGDKAVARGVKVYVGKIPVMYLPKYTQDLRNKPWFTFAPGHEKDLGYFLLTRSRVKINDYWTMTLRVDAYERTGFGWGTENSYRVPGMGAGLLRTYFINERQIAAKHPWQPKPGPTVVNERYQVEWRHKWDIDRQTSVMWQYYRLSDNVILPKYFEREFRRDPDVSTYFLLTRTLPVGLLTFRIDHRVNRFEAAVDRTPEINYTVASLPLGESGFYLQSTNTFSNLVARQPSPTEDRRKTMRFDTDNEISYPTRISFVQFTPWVGGHETYYSRSNDPDPRDVWRGAFKTGADLTTRFMKVFNFDRGFLGTDVTKMRHIISPSVSYLYRHMPTFPSYRLNQFDSAIDGLNQEHLINFSLENKLQAKVGKRTIELVRNLTTMPYYIEQKGRKGTLGPVQNIFEINPNGRLRLISDIIYDHRKDRLLQSNLDLYVRVNDRFGFDIGESYARGADPEHQLVTQFGYIINPKWKIRVYERFDPSDFTLVEQQYTVMRDLHEWEMGVLYNQTRGNGNQILLTFQLKAFPSQPFDIFGTSFHERKAGSQSTVVNQ